MWIFDDTITVIISVLLRWLKDFFNYCQIQEIFRFVFIQIFRPIWLRQYEFLPLKNYIEDFKYNIEHELKQFTLKTTGE